MRSPDLIVIDNVAMPDFGLVETEHERIVRVLGTPATVRHASTLKQPTLMQRLTESGATLTVIGAAWAVLCAFALWTARA